LFVLHSIVVVWKLVLNLSGLVVRNLLLMVSPWESRPGQGPLIPCTEPLASI